MSRTRSSKPLAEPTTTIATEPIVKWVGGKRRIADRILALMPSTIRTYYEPFCGGAAVFLALRNSPHVVGHYEISDACRPLIRTYRAIAADPVSVSAELETHRDQHCAVYYDTTREEFNDDRAVGLAADVRCAGRFIYLNRACFNGIYRVNQAGRFNVPFGKARHVALPSYDELRAFQRALMRAHVEAVDYREQLALAERTDVVYLDPPYDSPDDKGFTAYGAGEGRPWEFQCALANAATMAVARGATVIASNRATNRIRELWGGRGFEIHDLDVRHQVGATSDRRRKVGEILAVSKGR